MTTETGSISLAPDDASSLAPDDASPRPSYRIPEPVKRSLTVAAFLIIFFIYWIWLGDRFLNSDARMLDFHQNVPILFLALSAAVTLMAGQFDLSIGSMATLTTFLSVGLTTRHDWPLWLSLCLCIAVGALGGLINGLLVVKIRINTFIATLAMMGVLAGAARVFSGGGPVSISDPRAKHPLPSWFNGPDSLGAFLNKVPSALVWTVVALVLLYLVWQTVLSVRSAESLRSSTGTVAKHVLLAVLLLVVAISVGEAVSWTIGALLVVAFIMWLLIERMTTGRNLRAIGQNPTAARLAGINTEREVVKAFVIGGVLAAAGGVFLAANAGSAQPDVGAGFLLPALTAAFLSTVLLSAGRFTIWGTVAGGIVLVYVAQGLIAGGLAFTWTDIVNGGVLAIAVALSAIFRRT